MSEDALDFVTRHIKKRKREVIIMRFGLDCNGPMKFKEIAKTLNVSVRAVEQRCSRGICELRNIMNGYSLLFKALRKLGVFFILLLTSNLNASSVGLQWDANSEEDLFGYRIYASTKSLLTTTTDQARLDQNIVIWEVGKTTTTDVYLKGGTTYYFRATAFDDARNESGFNVDFSSPAQGAEVSAFIKRSDINGDGKVNVLDLGILAKELE